MRASQLAQALGVSRAAVNSWLKGEKLSLGNVVGIANALDVSLNWLVGGIGSVNLAADPALSADEENLLRLLRHLGDDALSQALGMLKAMQSVEQNPLKRFKAYDLVSRSELPIAVLDADGFLVYSNIYHNRLIGLGDDHQPSLNSHHFTEWIPRVFHRQFRSLLQDTLRQGHATYKNLQVRCPINQSVRTFIIHANAVSTHTGPGVHLLMKVIDSSVEKSHVYP